MKTSFENHSHISVIQITNIEYSHFFRGYNIAMYRQNLKTLRSAPKRMLYRDLRDELERANIECIIKAINKRRFYLSDIVEITKATYDKQKNIYTICIKIHSR